MTQRELNHDWEADWPSAWLELDPAQSAASSESKCASSVFALGHFPHFSKYDFILGSVRISEGAGQALEDLTLDQAHK